MRGAAGRRSRTGAWPAAPRSPAPDGALPGLRRRGTCGVLTLVLVVGAVAAELRGAEPRAPQDDGHRAGASAADRDQDDAGDDAEGDDADGDDAGDDDDRHDAGADRRAGADRPRPTTSPTRSRSTRPRSRSTRRRSTPRRRPRPRLRPTRRRPRRPRPEDDAREAEVDEARPRPSTGSLVYDPMTRVQRSTQPDARDSTTTRARVFTLNTAPSSDMAGRRTSSTSAAPRQATRLEIDDDDAGLQRSRLRRRGPTAADAHRPGLEAPAQLQRRRIAPTARRRSRSASTAAGATPTATCSCGSPTAAERAGRT